MFVCTDESRSGLDPGVKYKSVHCGFCVGRLYWSNCFLSCWLKKKNPTPELVRYILSDVVLRLNRGARWKWKCGVSGHALSGRIRPEQSHWQVKKDLLLQHWLNWMISKYRLLFHHLWECLFLCMWTCVCMCGVIKRFIVHQLQCVNLVWNKLSEECFYSLLNSPLAGGGTWPFTELLFLTFPPSSFGWIHLVQFNMWTETIHLSLYVSSLHIILQPSGISLCLWQ